MTVPLWILSFFAAVAGVLAISGSQLLAGQLAGPGVRAEPLPDQPVHRRPCGSSPSSTPWWPSSFVVIGLRLWSARSDRPALEGAFLRGAWYINELYDAVFGRPSERLAAFCADVVDPKVIDGAVNGVAGAFRGSGIAAAAHPDRLRAQLRARDRLRHRRRARLHADPDVVGLMTATSFPYLTILVLVPAVGAAVVALVPEAGGRRLVPRGRSAWP